MASLQPRRQLTGVVVSAGKMMRTVKVQVAKQKWNRRIQKWFAMPENILVSDPSESVREGDVVSLESGRRVSKHVHHTVTAIVAPMGPPLSERPRLPSVVERLATQKAKRAAKDVRQAERGRFVAIERIKQREARQKQKEKEAKRAEHAERMRRDAIRRGLREKRALLSQEKRELAIKQKEQTDAQILAARKIILPTRLTNRLKTIEKRMKPSNLSEEMKQDLETQRQQIMSDLTSVKEGKPSVYLAQTRRAERAKRRVLAEKNGLTPTPLPLDKQVKRAEKLTNILSAMISQLTADLNKLVHETGMVLEKPEEQVSLELTIAKMKHSLQQQQEKITRIAEYNKNIRGFEDEFKRQELKWQRLIRKLGFTRAERIAALIALHGEGAPRNSKNVLNAQMSSNVSSSVSSNDSSNIKSETESRANEIMDDAATKVQETEKVAEQVEESLEKKENRSGGLFGWFKN